MKQKMCKSCGRILGIAYFATDIDNPFKKYGICIKCMNEQKLNAIECTKCGRKLPQTAFARIQGGYGIHSMCKECRKPYLTQTLKIAKQQHFACAYTTNRCEYSAKYGMCCFECPMKQWCDDACGNKPLPEPKGCGCIAK